MGPKCDADLIHGWRAHVCSALCTDLLPNHLSQALGHKGLLTGGGRLLLGRVCICCTEDPPLFSDSLQSLKAEGALLQGTLL